MQAIPLKAQERTVLGKAVKNLRKAGLIPGHVYGNKTEIEHVSVNARDFLKVLDNAGETTLVDLKIGEEKVKHVLIRGVQTDAVKGLPLHIDFYEVNLKEKVTVPVPIILQGVVEEIELVKTGEAVVIQSLSEVQVEALPTEIPENLIVNVLSLRVIGDAIHVSELQVPEGVTILAEPEEVVVKLDTAITEEMKRLMEEQAAEAAAAQEAAVTEEGATAEGEVPAEGEVVKEGEESTGSTPPEVKEEPTNEPQ
ncbi:hypothetical protein A3C32_00930 [Candidatus Daviesbacteria bacterium RIFCSPHIGHO2_02_FULL_41_14]|nr:MAG: hypothetical protein A3C32_00930 [Candidatus Daviesbacteria bacterium RIFCSPHIGHO2_02_FULL_41_14]